MTNKHHSAQLLALPLLILLLFGCTNKIEPNDSASMNTVVATHQTDKTTPSEDLRTANPRNTNTQLNEWMKDLPDNLPISKMSIPGTHDSGMDRARGIGKNWAITQSLSIKDQLEQGIRFLDIRLKPIKAGNKHILKVYHGNFDAQKELGEDVLKVISSFLQAHPSEFVILSIKDENVRDRQDLNRIATIAMEKLNQHNVLSRWDFSPDTPLKYARGKILVLSRSKELFSYAQVTTFMPKWVSQGVADFSEMSNGQIEIEDKYNSNIGTKIADAQRNINKASKGIAQRDHWYITFFSVSNGLWPWNSSSAINSQMGSFIQKSSLYSTGIVSMDFATKDMPLIKEIIKVNHSYIASEAYNRETATW